MSEGACGEVCGREVGGGRTNYLPLGASARQGGRCMAFIGKRNQLPFVREATPGYYLDGGMHGEILLPGRYLTRRPAVGSLMNVFVYRDSEDRLVATTEHPYAAVGEFGFLRVASINPRIGVFLDWGLEKDLLLPAREQTGPLQVGDWLMVYVMLDERTDRIVASARLNRHFEIATPTYPAGAPVKLIVISESPLGYNVVVDHKFRGLLYGNDLAGPLSIGQPLDGFVKMVRDDGKIDLTLNLPRVGYQRIVPVTEKILATLAASRGGYLPLHDNSPPEEIRAAFGVSKKAFKQAIGVLFKAKQIVIEKTGIRLVAEAGKKAAAGEKARS